MRLYLALLILPGCAAMLGHGPPREEAASVERSLCGPSFHPDQQVYLPEHLQSIEPYYTVIHTRSEQTSRLRGVQLRIAAQPSFTAEWITRSLRCHSVRQQLGTEPAVVDPFWLPDSWVDIEVLSEGAAFLVRVTTPELDEARLLVDRARIYAPALFPR